MIHPIAQSQFREGAVGTLITQVNPYLDLLSDQIVSFSFPKDGDSAGQGFIPIPGGEGLVLPGIGLRTLLSETTGVIREHRGEKQLCLDRTKADIGHADSVAAIVYTLDAYLKDPEVSKEDKKSAEEGPYTHVLITTLGFKGPKGEPPVSPHRFARNIAGGNRKYLSTGKSIVAKATGSCEEVRRRRSRRSRREYSCLGLL